MTMTMPIHPRMDITMHMLESSHRETPKSARGATTRINTRIQVLFDTSKLATRL